MSKVKQENEFEVSFEKYNDLECRAIECEENIRRVHYLLRHVEEQVEEVEGIYLMSKRKNREDNYNDYVTENLDELRALVEIAYDYTNRK